METSGRDQWQASVRQQHSNGPGVIQLLKDAQLYKRPRVVGFALLWMFGLSSVFLLPAPQKITPESFQRFEEKLRQVGISLSLSLIGIFSRQHIQLRVVDFCGPPVAQRAVTCQNLPAIETNCSMNLYILRLSSVAVIRVLHSLLLQGHP